MNATRILSAALLLGALGASLAHAAPAVGTAKARGDYGANFGTAPSSSGWSRTHYVAPTRSAPAVVAPAPTAVAQAPQEVRRFSYAPQAPAATSAPTPCPPATQAVSGRRYSYAPAPAVESAPVVRSYQPAYRSSRRSTGGHRDLWALPKTDPRKYSSR
jgi:hypothetical protein